jgi:hypothetical protein
MPQERRYISVPERWGEDENLLAIPVGEKGQAMILGVSKCRAIVKHIQDIELFVKDQEDKRHAQRRVIP